MKIEAGSLEAFKNWKLTQLKQLLNKAIINAGYAPSPALYERIVVKSIPHQLFPSKAYYLDYQTAHQQLLFSTTLLLDEKDNPTLVVELPHGQREFIAFTTC